MSLRSLVLTSVAALAVGTYAHASTFAFEGSIGQTPTFSLTSGGVTATFTSTPGNVFAVQDTTNLLPFNTTLLDNGYNADPLTITFSSPVTSVSIPFLIEDAFAIFGPDSLSVTTNLGQTATFAAPLDMLGFSEPTGLLNLTLTSPTTTLTLTGSSAIGIGDFSAVAATPEPTSLVLLGTGLAGLWTRRRRG